MEYVIKCSYNKDKRAFVVIRKCPGLETVSLIFINVYLLSLKALFIHGSNLERKKSILHLCLPWQQVIIHSYEERLLGALPRYRPLSLPGPWWWQRDEGRVKGWQETGHGGQEIDVHTWKKAVRKHQPHKASGRTENKKWTHKKDNVTAEVGNLFTSILCSSILVHLSIFVCLQQSDGRKKEEMELCFHSL